jgi:hypothetical protein
MRPYSFQIGGVPRVLERLQQILAKKYPTGPCNEDATPHVLDRKGILDDLVRFIREMWNMASLGSREHPSEVRFVLPRLLRSKSRVLHYAIASAFYVWLCAGEWRFE